MAVFEGPFAAVNAEITLWVSNERATSLIVDTIEMADAVLSRTLNRFSCSALSDCLSYVRRERERGDKVLSDVRTKRVCDYL